MMFTGKIRVVDKTSGKAVRSTKKGVVFFVPDPNKRDVDAFFDDDTSIFIKDARILTHNNTLSVLGKEALVSVEDENEG
jgi:hypothetical protein